MEGKELQIQLEQTIAKEETPFTSVQERSRSSKSKSKSKSRRSPYPHINHTHSSDFNSPVTAGASTPEYPSDRQSYGEYNQDVMSSYTPSLVYNAPQDTAESRYSALYASTYGATAAGLYGDSAMGMYPYAPHRYLDESRGCYYDDKYYVSRDPSSLYPGYVTSTSTQVALTAPESARTIQSPDSRESSSCRHSDSTHSLGYESCLQSGQHAPRSTSRENYSMTLNHTPATNQSSISSNYYGSSASCVNSSCSRAEVSGANADQPTHNSTKKKTPPNGLRLDHIESTTKASVTKSEERKSRLGDDKLVKASHHQSSGDTGSSTTKEPNTQQSVIMRRPSQHAASADMSSTNLSCRRASEDLIKTHTSSATNVSPSAITRAGALADMSGGLYGTGQCTYDFYGKASTGYNSTALQTAQRGYPVMPQAGYTSVIVEPQHYQMANGYVH